MAANAETMTTNAVANYGAGGGGSGRFVFAEELDFYLDMALNECQRWLEAVTRERFIDDDDFLYSLRYGTQLRQVVNRVLPDCFEWTAGVGCDDFGYGGVRRLASAEDREDWVAHLLLICWRRLRFAPEELFQPEDLDCAESSAAYFDNSRHDRPTDESPSTSLLRADADRLRRVCATIARLAVACAGDARIPRFDQSALEPLLAYHQSLYRSGRERPLCHPLDRPLRDVRQALRSAVDIICAEEETALRPVSPNSDEGIGTMVDCVNEKVSKYLAELPSCDQMSYGDAKSSRSNSPTMTRHRNYDAHIPTRLVTKTATSVAHNPLQFIAAKTNAIALSEQAKQQLQIVDEQKKLRTETLLVTHEEEETTWLSNLDQWRSKRKSVLRNKTSEEMSADHDHIDAEARSQQKLVRKFSEEPRFFGNNHSPDNPTVKKETTVIESVAKHTKELSVNSDEHIDSGIDREEGSASPGHSASSASLSPRNDGKLTLTASDRYFGHSKPLFIRSPSPIEPPSIPAPPPPPMPTSHLMAHNHARLSETKTLPPTASIQPFKRDTREIGKFGESEVKKYNISEKNEPEQAFESVKNGLEQSALGVSESSQNGSGKNGSSQDGVQKREPVVEENLLSRNLHHNEYDHNGIGTIPSGAGIAKLLDTDSSIAAYQPKKETVNGASTTTTASGHSIKDDELPAGTMKIVIETLGNNERGFGFTVSGGKDRRASVTVDTVVVDTPADRSGLHVGDTVITINGEAVEDKYHASVNRMIHEAVRLGEIELVIKREGNVVGPSISSSANQVNRPLSPLSQASFDKKRTLFDRDQEEDTYYKFRQNRKHNHKWETKPMRNPAAGVGPIYSPSQSSSSCPSPSMEVARSVQSTEQSVQFFGREENQRDRFDNFTPDFQRERTSSCTSTSSDYRVTSIHDTKPPGKLSDFIPEVERAAAEAQGDTAACDVRRREIEKDCILKVTQTQEPKLLRNYDLSLLKSDGEVSSPPAANIKTSYDEPAVSEPASSDSQNTNGHATAHYMHEQERKQSIELSEEQSAQSLLDAKLYLLAKNRKVRERMEDARCNFLHIDIPLTERKKTGEVDDSVVDAEVYRRWDDQKQGVDRAEQLLSSPTVFDSPKQFAYDHSSLGVESNLSPRSANEHAYYHYSPNNTLTKRTVIVVPIRSDTDAKESQEWKNIIQQQRLPSPGIESSKNILQADQKFSVVSASKTPSGALHESKFSAGSAQKSINKSRLPAFGLTEVTRVSKLHSQPMEPELRYLHMAASTHASQPSKAPVASHDHWMVREAQHTQRLSDQLRSARLDNANPAKANGSFNYQPVGKSSRPSQHHHYANLPGPDSHGKRTEESIVAVSGKHLCSHCQMELGRGAAMIIESLDLFYHLSCFRCYVCNIALGNGVQGADVRVRDAKLHCQSCYSNDEAGLKYSEV